MNILFISTLNLATNPRLFKEIKLALDNGHEVTVVCFEFNNWSYSFNKELLQQISNATVTIIPANRKPLVPWLFSVVKEQGFRWLGKLTRLRGKTLSQAVSRRSDLLLRAIQKLEEPFDLVIGHNPGALYPTVVAGKKFHCATGFDMEDYHPGEGSDPHEQALIKKLISLYLPQMNYVSYAAPLIMKKTREDIGKNSRHELVILNYFPSGDFIEAGNIKSDALQLVWFSQNVNHKRGLEQIIPVVEQFHPAVHLTLIGNKKEEFYKAYIENKKAVTLLDPMDQLSLHRAMNRFDVGLAIEPGKDKNNFIALANKLITYFQSGLYILASDTPAHNDFFSTHPRHGIAVSLESKNIPVVLDKLLAQKQSIRATFPERMENRRKNSWETESDKLLNIWSKIIAS